MTKIGILIIQNYSLFLQLFKSNDIPKAYYTNMLLSFKFYVKILDSLSLSLHNSAIHGEV